MDLKALLNKTAKKNKDFDVPKIKPFSIAMDDRPYDELLPKESLKQKTSDTPEIIEEPTNQVLETEKLPKIELAIPLSVVSQHQILEETQPKAADFKQELKVKKTEIRKVQPKKSLQKQGRVQEKTSHKIIDKIAPVKELPPSIQEIETLATNRAVSETPLLEEPGTAFLLLSGCQKKIVDYFFELSIKHNSSKIGPITTDTIAMTLDITSETFRKSIQRLKSKGIIYTYLSKEGRGGWSIYEFNSAFYQELISNARLKTGFKFEPQAVSSMPEPVLQSKVGDLPAIWSGLEYQDLAEYGFTKNHLTQIYKDQEKASVILDLEAMQYALDAFKFDMENNEQILKDRLRNKSPVMFLTQILGKGRPYGSFTPEKFKTPEQLAILKYKEKKEQVNKELQSLKDAYFETEFQSWYENLSEQDSDEILSHLNVKLDGVPEKLRITFKMRAYKDYFSQFVWLDVVKRFRKNN